MTNGVVSGKPLDGVKELAQLFNSVRPLTEVSILQECQPIPSFGELKRVRSSEKEFVALGRDEGNQLEFFELKDLVGDIKVENLFDSFDEETSKQPLAGLEQHDQPGLLAAVGETFYNTALISNICELGTRQVKDPDMNERFLLNNNPAFDRSTESGVWQNWTVKTFTPTPPFETSKSSQLEAIRVSTSTKVSWPTQQAEFGRLLSSLASTGQVFADPRFKPSIQSLRGFGGDTSWE